MINIALRLGVILTALQTLSLAQDPNPLIDPEGHQKLLTLSMQERPKKTLSERQFAAAMLEKDVVILDARSLNDFNELHVQGAVHLPLVEFNEESLARIIPTKTTKVLIYCNNNFLISPTRTRGISKMITMPLNLQIRPALMAYGYHNVYELSALLNPDKTKIKLKRAK